MPFVLLSLAREVAQAAAWPQGTRSSEVHLWESCGAWRDLEASVSILRRGHDKRPRRGWQAQGLFYRGAVVATSPGQEGGLRSELCGLCQALFLPCSCKELLAEQFCFMSCRVFKGMWKWGRRNGSAQQQNFWALLSKPQPIKRYEAFPCGEGTPCSHSVSPLPHPEFVTKSPLSPVRAGDSPVMQRGCLIARQKQLGRRRRGRSLLSARAFSLRGEFLKYARYAFIWK